MITRDSIPPVQTRADRLRFDRYVLDLDRGCLLLDGNEIALRPKTFAVLNYLIENSGRLVSKDELIAAVWPNLAITDDALVQSIGELRRALGDDGPRLIRTIPRRGYRFESDVSVAPVDPSISMGMATVATSHDGVQPSEPATRAYAPISLTDRRGRLFVALTVVIVIAAGALWASLGSEWKFLDTLRSGDQIGRAHV